MLSSVGAMTTTERRRLNPTSICVGGKEGEPSACRSTARTTTNLVKHVQRTSIDGTNARTVNNKRTLIVEPIDPSLAGSNAPACSRAAIGLSGSAVARKFKIHPPRSRA
tara:strand:- start:693 stop:1019 length:327 start_codon:yes stop_codon:yes gene_type:complete